MNLMMKSLVGLCVIAGSSMAWGMGTLLSDDLVAMARHQDTLSRDLHAARYHKVYSHEVAAEWTLLGAAIIPIKWAIGYGTSRVSTPAGLVAVCAGIIGGAYLLHRSAIQIFRKFLEHNYANSFASIQRARQDKIAFEQMVIDRVRNADLDLRTWPQLWGATESGTRGFGHKLRTELLARRFGLRQAPAAQAPAANVQQAPVPQNVPGGVQGDQAAAPVAEHVSAADAQQALVAPDAHAAAVAGGDAE